MRTKFIVPTLIHFGISVMWFAVNITRSASAIVGTPHRIPTTYDWAMYYGFYALTFPFYLLEAALRQFTGSFAPLLTIVALFLASVIWGCVLSSLLRRKPNSPVAPEASVEAQK